MKRNRKKRK